MVLLSSLAGPGNVAEKIGMVLEGCPEVEQAGIETQGGLRVRKKVGGPIRIKFDAETVDIVVAMTQACRDVIGVETNYVWGFKIPVVSMTNIR
jgi:hypothetical protein